jgi:hypothetical protein
MLESEYYEFKGMTIPIERCNASKEIIEHDLVREWNRKWWNELGEANKVDRVC